MSTSADEQELVAAYPRLLVENYSIIASAALLWFDFALTLTREVELVWKGKRSNASILFLVMRYTALVERIILCLIVLSWNVNDQTCGGFEHTDDVLTILNYFSVALFTVVRLHAIKGKDSGWVLSIVVASLAIVKPALVIVESANYVPVQTGAPTGCANLYSLSQDTFTKFSISGRVTGIAAETIFIVVMWKKTYSSWGATMRMPLSKTVLRDGTAYYIVLVCLQIVTMITISIGSTLAVWTVWSYFEQVITVMLFSRFLLNLRGIDQGPASTSSQLALGLSKIEFNDAAGITGLRPTLRPLSVYSDPDPHFITGRVQPSEDAPIMDLELSYHDQLSVGSSRSSDGWGDGVDVVPRQDSRVGEV